MLSHVGDLTVLAKDLEGVFEKHFQCRPAMAIAFTLPPDSDEAHWVTNVSREDGVLLFQKTAKKMIVQTN